MIRSRLVLNFPGFEQTDPDRQLDRVRHSAQKTGEIWNFSVERKSVSHEDGDNFAVADWESRSGDWRTETRIVQFSWNDIIRSYEKIAHPAGFIRNLPKFFAFFFDGTIVRYWRASPRYFAFTVFPILLLAIFAIVSWFVASFVIGLLVSPGLMHLLLTLLGAIVLVLLLCKWPGDRLNLLLTINDWGFARDMVNRVNPEIEARYREFADCIKHEIANSEHDEIVISGHSFGSVWAVAACAIALEEDPDLLKGRKITFLALGSSLLKIALAPNAQFLRDWIAAITRQPDLFWHEIQTKDDIIAFYKADPFEALSLPAPAGGLVIDRVKYKNAMDRNRYRSMRTSFYRTHRQYILYQDKRVTFDYMLRLFGPLAVREIAEQPEKIHEIDPAANLV